MRVSNRFQAVLLSMGLLYGGAAAAADTMPSAGDCFVAGLEANDATSVAECYADDAIIWFPGGSMAKGRAAIREGFAHFLGGFMVKDAQMSTIGQEELGDTRVVWGTYAIRLVNKSTQAESLQQGRFTDVQKKIDGRWLYTVDHPSDDPAQPQAQE